MTKDELKELLEETSGDRYYFDKDTIFIKEQNITVEAGGNFYNGSQPKQRGGEVKEDEEDKGLLQQLIPIFMDNEHYANQFLKEIRGKKGMRITEIVRIFRSVGKLSPELCHHNLWKVLSDAGIYDLTERNWNERIKY